MRVELRLAGAGGQGLITAGIILAEACAKYTDLNVAQTQSYGPESRGGASRADVIISSNEIDYPEVKAPDVLVVMTQEAADKYIPGVKDGGTVIVDTTYVKQLPEAQSKGFKVIEFPISGKARELGREIVANIVALGLLTEATGIVPNDAVMAGVLNRVPKGTEELNKQAFAAGVEAAKGL
ncbi:MAG: 2-oxoacid:acceptor oxidoreductase family protein [Bacillota bacterium]|jgi:2-oxoglutarate ferredoxin oxidoreductase subunit gamma|nr:2-oxoacid:ferredoxin oxidoreductase subunit gamma [Candidatus Fermentithermobacillaceae bacterium]